MNKAGTKVNRILSVLVPGFAIAVAGSFAFISPLLAQQGQRSNFDDIFIAEDSDSFDPGLPVGAQFPPIRALYEGREITEIDEFVRDKGAVFIANRSVDW